jgi:phospholipase C
MRAHARHIGINRIKIRLGNIMPSPDRRQFLQLLAGGAMASALPASIARALAIPAHHKSGTIADVEYIVVLMQENRSFDHYFGTLGGVRGFGDPRPAMLSTGNPIWYQPEGTGYVLPYHPTAANLGLQFLGDLAHDWTTTHAAWNSGNYDGWVQAKGSLTMAYLTRADIPYHYALADAFTICDAYHCSLLGPTDPNRLHLWTGWVGNDGTGGGPALDNDGTDYSWRTFPENLQAAGITWKVYQDIGFGLNAANEFGWAISDPLAGNYADNPLAYFAQYQTAPVGSPLNTNALTGTDVVHGGQLLSDFVADINAGTLPQVSWIVAPEAFSEHPNWPANYGAWYISQVLDALTAKPEVWSKTALFICYDENDGFFDHMVPVTPPVNRAQGISTVGTTNEIFAGNATYPAGPIGLGARVPMLVVSPWSKGGYVNSQLFDHTSVIRFIEQRFAGQSSAVYETNITAWRRCIVGDLTGAFNFATPNDTVGTLPSTTGYVPPNGNRAPSYVPTPPTTQAIPAQEPGQRPARALPYQFTVNATRSGVGLLEIGFENTGAAGAGFQVRAGGGAFEPRVYTLAAGTSVSDSWILGGHSSYDLTVYGANGFLRQFQGSLAAGSTADLLVFSRYNAAGTGIRIEVVNNGLATCQVSAVNLYTQQTVTQSVAPGGIMVQNFALTASGGWYDVAVTVDADPLFVWRYAGHLENGADFMTDPGIGTGL